MHAIGYRIPLPIEEPQSLVDIELPRPAAEGRDLLVAVKAVSVNPIDTKVRRSVAPEADQWKVLGWDAAGVVVETGPQAGLFRPGDEVYYAGALTRPGTNAEFHRVDERIVGRKPATLSWAEAAALPLTAITAWEALFDRLDVANRIVAGAAPAVLIVGGAGGVGSIAIQLARRLTDLAVIATASRPESRQWALDLGAHHVVDHGLPLADQVAALGLGAPAFVFGTTHTQVHAPEIARLIAPQGCLALIDSPELDFNLFKQKSVSIHWELMFTRSMFETADMGEQGALLNRVAQLVDAGQVRTTLSETLGSIDAANLKRAHERIEGGHTRGKLVLEGF